MLYQHTEPLDAALSAGVVAGYCGFDPTAPSLHVGNLVPVMGLAHCSAAAASDAMPGRTKEARVGGESGGYRGAQSRTAGNWVHGGDLFHETGVPVTRTHAPKNSRPYSIQAGRQLRSAQLCTERGRHAD